MVRFYMLVTCLCVSVALVDAQTVIKPTSTCPSCKITLKRVLTIPSDGSEKLGTPENVRRAPGGAWYVTSSETAHEITVFDSLGKFVRRMGRRGEGPGEFAYIRQLVLRGDTIIVLDQQHNRITLLSPQGSVLRTIPVPFRPLAILPAAGDTLVVNGIRATRDVVGEPYHLFVAQTPVRSFGYTGEVIRFDIPYIGWREIASAHEGFWAAHVSRYELSHWTLQGNMTRHLRRDVSWFPPLTEPVTGYGPTQPPPPRIVGIQQRRDGWLIVAGVVPARDFQRGLKRIRESAHGDHFVIDDFQSVFDSIIEIIDPNAARAIATLRIDPYIIGFSDENHLATWRMSGGNSFVDVWYISLTP
jgi:hypothetical protein